MPYTAEGRTRGHVSPWKAELTARLHARIDRTRRQGTALLAAVVAEFVTFGFSETEIRTKCAELGYSVRLGRIVRRATERQTDWTAYELRTLRTLYAKPNWSARRIAERLGRSAGAVHSMASKLGLVKVRRPVAGEVRGECVKTYVRTKAGKTAVVYKRQCADCGALIAKRATWCFRCAKRHAVRPDGWSATEDVKLLDLFDRGLTWKEVSTAFPGRSVAALQQRVKRLRGSFGRPGVPRSDKKPAGERRRGRSSDFQSGGAGATISSRVAAGVR